MMETKSPKEIKGLLLAAGLGRRLRPLTDSKPKCLMQVGGKKMLERWLDELRSCGCSEVIINTHYLAEQVTQFIDSYKTKYSIEIENSYEYELLGTAGTLRHNINKFRNKIGILMHSDNATEFELKKLLDNHYKRPRHCIITMLTFNTREPKSCGMTKTDSDGVLTEYVEKPNFSDEKHANAAIYIFENEFIDWFKANDKGYNDFSKEILPMLIGKAFVYHTNEEYIDIGTPENLKKANNIWS